MKTKQLKTLCLLLLSSLFIAGACSSDDDGANPNDPNNNDDPTDGISNHIMGSMNMTNQVGYLETIAMTDGNYPNQSHQVRCFPHTIFVPTFTRAFLTQRVGIGVNDIVFAIIGQRLINETVQGEDEIANFLDSEPFDYTYTLFVVHRDGLNIDTNATIETATVIDRVNEVDDFNEVTNRRLTAGDFTITAQESGLLGQTVLDNDNAIVEDILTQQFVVNEQAFTSNRDGNILVQFNGSLNNILADTFNASESVPIVVLQVIQGLSGTRTVYTHPSLQ